MTCRPHRLIGLAAAAAALAGAACAQPLDLSLPDRAAAPIAAAQLGSAGRPAARPAPDLANPLDPVARPVLQTNGLQSAVFARTALDHRFSKRDDLTGSVGFLCGLQPGHKDGGAAAYGVDPHGRFVGAKFSLAFR